MMTSYLLATISQLFALEKNQRKVAQSRSRNNPFEYSCFLEAQRLKNVGVIIPTEKIRNPASLVLRRSQETNSASMAALWQI